MKNYLGLLILMLCLGCNSNQKKQNDSKLEEKISEFESDEMGNFSQYRDITGLVDAKEFRRLIQECDTCFIIDARPADVYKTSPHIKGAHPIKADGHLKYMIKDLNKKRRIMVYCGKEVISPYVIKHLIKAGFDNVYELQGGLNAWRDAGYKLEEKKKKLKRQFLG